MKTILVLIAIAISLPAFGETAKKNPMSVEMIEGPTTRPYTMITPLSSDKKSLEGAFKELREKAAKVNADAVVEYECQKGQKARGGGIFGIGNKVTVQSGCAGKAVKWN